jgi:hypothetical protein
VKGLRQKFEQWLGEYFDVDRTRKGSIRKTRGVRVYEGDIDPLLGHRFGWGTVNLWRSGEAVPARLLTCIERIVELEDPEAIRAAVLDERFVDEVRHAVRHHEQFGSAPDGGELRAWVRRCRERIGAPIQGGEARKLWRKHGVPANNRRRYSRRKGAA